MTDQQGRMIDCSPASSEPNISIAKAACTQAKSKWVGEKLNVSGAGTAYVGTLTVEFIPK
jgi:hypothetical protein